MNTEMKMEKRKLSELRPADYNPRKLLTPEDKEYQDIKRSIEKFGYVDPIIINSDGTVIGGHQRINVLMDLGYDEADVVIVDLDKDNEKALNIALNKITGEWDEIKLKNLLLELDLNEYDLQNTGFSAGEIEDLCVRLEKEVEAEDDNFDLEEELEKIEDPITRRGDVWMCGFSETIGSCAETVRAQKMWPYYWQETKQTWQSRILRTMLITKTDLSKTITWMMYPLRFSYETHSWQCSIA